MSQRYIKLSYRMFTNTAASHKLLYETEETKPVGFVTGMGLMIGIKTVKPAAEVVSQCMENGVLSAQGSANEINMGRARKNGSAAASKNH